MYSVRFVNFLPAIAFVAVMTSGARAAVGNPESGAEPRQGSFKPLKRTSDGITVSRCEGPTKGYYISRFDVQVPADADQMAEGLWRAFDHTCAPVSERNFIKRSTNELVFNDHVKTPVVTDREYTLQVRRGRNGSTRFISFATAPELGPAPDPAYVRMKVVSGGWEIRPAPTGGCFVRYEVYTEPGGSVPALLIRDPLTNDALNYVRRCVSDALDR